MPCDSLNQLHKLLHNPYFLVQINIFMENVYLVIVNQYTFEQPSSL